MRIPTIIFQIYFIVVYLILNVGASHTGIAVGKSESESIAWAKISSSVNGFANLKWKMDITQIMVKLQGVKNFSQGEAAESLLSGRHHN